LTADAEARRRRALVAALGFALLRQADVEGAPALGALRQWLGSWAGIGLVAAGMARQGYDLSLSRYDDLGWRATFYVAGREHSPTAATGSAFDSTSCGAVQAAAWQALGQHWND
jgi:hypothetical protein